MEESQVKTEGQVKILHLYNTTDSRLEITVTFNDGTIHNEMVWGWTRVPIEKEGKAVVTVEVQYRDNGPSGTLNVYSYDGAPVKWYKVSKSTWGKPEVKFE
jgi:hypothetical protein